MMFCRSSVSYRRNAPFSPVSEETRPAEKYSYMVVIATGVRYLCGMMFRSYSPASSCFEWCRASFISDSADRRRVAVSVFSGEAFFCPPFPARICGIRGCPGASPLPGRSDTPVINAAGLTAEQAAHIRLLIKDLVAANE